MFILYKGFSFIPNDDDLLIVKSGVVIARFPINKKLMTTTDIIELIDEVLEM